MENSLKQRLVGALVLIALAIIFLPPILKDNRQQEPFESQIPTKPVELINVEIDKASVEKNTEIQSSLDKLESSYRKTKSASATNADELDVIEPADTSKITQKSSDTLQRNTSKGKLVENNNQSINTDKTTKADKPVSSASSAQPEQKQTLSENFKDAAWVIQIASFSNKENATKFIEKLKKSKHPAYKKIVKKNNQTVYRIFVGPYIDKQDAQKSLSSVNELSPSPGILQVFDPSKH
jgi:DedD protein